MRAVRRLLALGAVVTMFGRPAPARAADGGRPDAELVVLLHGLSRTHRSMKRLERALVADGYNVLNLRYPAGRKPLQDLTLELERALAPFRNGPSRRVHFVAHSLGGIVVRGYLHARPELNVGRVVMLAPPNGGSELVDVARKIPWLRDHMGPSRGQLGTGQNGPGSLGPVRFDTGVIAGNRSFNPLFSWLIPGPDDGMVSVERTKVAGMADFLVVPHSHTFLMRSGEVIRQTLVFLKQGKFDRGVPA